MWPAFRSASIAICLPGMASKVNRAATSLIRPPPLVMTTKLMMKMMMKMMIPTGSDPPATKSLNAITTSPASWIASLGSLARSPAVRISRVVATFSTSRKRVSDSSSEGKTENSSGLCT